MTKRFYSIMGNSQKLDGGAMFGNVPKAMWQRWVKVDDENRIDLACRALLVVDKIHGKDTTILFETGIGAFFEPKLRARYGVQEEQHILLNSLKEAGFEHHDIDIVILSHLHFDHAGGLLSQWHEGKTPKLLFPNAKFVVGSEAWQRALKPHPRDRASFIPELTQLLEESERLVQIDGNSCELLGNDYRFSISNGHTPGMLLSEIATNDGPIVFAADLVPGTPWVHLPITMGYDRFPEALIDEKTTLLNDLMARGGGLFFTHDPEISFAKLDKDEKGRFIANPQLKTFVNKIF